MFVDPSVPIASVTAPVGRSTASGGLTVTWIESAAAPIVSRTLTEEAAQAPRPGSCAGASWQTAWSRAATSPLSVTGLGKLMCYRFRVTLTDSAGHTGNWYSGEVVTGP